MADDRAALDPNEQLAKLQRDFDDLKSTLLARASRLTTGSIEPTVLTTAKVDTLLLQGQAVSRATYSVLWQWVQDNSLVTTGLFTVGDGSSTFGLPDFRGRVIVGAGTLAVGAKVGADSLALTTANMPTHDHNVSASGTTNSTGSHNHAITSDGGNHGGHFPTSQFNAAAGGDLGVAAWNGGVGNSAHNHNGGTDSGGAHSHTVSLSVSESTVGSGTPVDMRQASIAVNWLLWT